MSVINERYPYRYVIRGYLPNGHPDCRMEKFCTITKLYREVYLFDNQMQMMTAMEDYDYSLWLDPDGMPCYTKSRIENPYPQNK